MAYSELTPQRTTSTSISVPISCCYNVFINHRGPDVKKTFASHLYRRLLREGVRVFLDKLELQQGLNVPSQIEDAIRSASVHVALFSPKYAESKCCLDELLQMIESGTRGARIIPVFYHVRPADLNGESGLYAQSLRKLEEKSRHAPSTIQNWREALSFVSDIAGFEVDADNTDEGEVVDKVVESVLNMIKERRSDEPAEDDYPNKLSEPAEDGCPNKPWSLIIIVSIIFCIFIIVVVVIYHRPGLLKNLKNKN